MDSRDNEEYLPDFFSAFDKILHIEKKVYLYVIESPSIPNRVKVGITKDVIKRLTEIDKGRYSLPVPYELKHLFYIEDADIIEKICQLYLWKQGMWFFGELFNCEAKYACAIIRSIIQIRKKFNKNQSPQKMIGILQDIALKLPDDISEYEIPHYDKIFIKAQERFFRSLKKKKALIDSGHTEFYQIATHRTWYINE